MRPRRFTPHWTWITAPAALVLALLAGAGQPLPGDRPGLHLLTMLPRLPVRVMAAASSEIVLVVLAVVLAWTLRRQLRPLQFGALVGGAVVLERVLKALVHRPRPMPVEEGWGFPSGHSLVAMTLGILVLGALWPELSRPARRWLTLGVVLSVALVGLDRVALGAHWPSDVLGAWLLGLTYGAWTIPWVLRAGRPMSGEHGGADAARSVPAPVQR